MKPENEMPREIWLEDIGTAVGSVLRRESDGMPKYIRADTVPTPEELKQVKEALKKMMKRASHSQAINYKSYNGEMGEALEALAILEKLGEREHE